LQSRFDFVNHNKPQNNGSLNTVKCQNFICPLSLEAEIDSMQSGIKQFFESLLVNDDINLKKNFAGNFLNHYYNFFNLYLFYLKRSLGY